MPLRALRLRRTRRNPGQSWSPYVTFYDRFLAFMIDMSLIALAAGAIGYLAHAPRWDQTHRLVSFAFVWLYYALMESSPLQATLGKWLLGYRVTDLFGNRISFLRASARHFAILLSLIPVGGGYLLIWVSDRRQALHDMISGCVHVYG